MAVDVVEDADPDPDPHLAMEGAVEVDEEFAKRKSGTQLSFLG